MTNKVLVLFILSCSVAIVESCSSHNFHAVRPEKFYDENGNLDWDKFDKEMDSMGDRIDQHVHDEMKPVLDMNFRTKVQSGEDGITVAQFEDKWFIVQDGVLYECDGTISTDNGECDGDTTKFRVRKKSDYCYLPITSQINDYYCIAPSGSSVSSGYSWGKAYCKSENGDALLLTSDEYQDLCEGKSGNVKYKYFTYAKIDEHGPEVKCKGKNPTVCVLKSHGTNVMTTQ